MIHLLVRFLSRCRPACIAGCALVLAACAALPAQEMSNARQAINAAAQSGGDQQAGPQMQAARAALAQAEIALKHAQYKQARQSAQQARAIAIEVQQLLDTP